MEKDEYASAALKGDEEALFARIELEKRAYAAGPPPVHDLDDSDSGPGVHG